MSGDLVGLVTQDLVGKVALGLEAAVLQSFETDQARTSPLLLRTVPITQAEMKRRAQMALRIFRELRGDLGWGVDRILDSLPTFLRQQLDGIPWEPEAKRAMWAKEGDPL